MVHLVFTKTTPIISVIMKTDPKFKILAYKAKRGFLTQSSKGRTWEGGVGVAWCLNGGGEEEEASTWVFSSKNNTHTHTHTQKLQPKEQGRKEKRKRSSPEGGETALSPA